MLTMATTAMTTQLQQQQKRMIMSSMQQKMVAVVAFCALLFYSQHYILHWDNKKCTANERTNEHCLASCYIFVRATPKCECMYFMSVVCCVGLFFFSFFSFFFLLRLFSSSLRPTFWCHFRVSIVRATDRTIDIDGTIDFLPAPKIAKCIRTHKHIYMPNFLELFATFFPFQHFLFCLSRAISWKILQFYKQFCIVATRIQ